MNRALVRLFFLAGFGWPALAAERDVRHEFPVQPGCTLKLDTYRGMITVTESDEALVRVAIHMEVGGETEAAAERVLAGLQLDVTERDNTVSIFARNPRETRARWVWREDEQIGLFYRITVPQRCHVEITNVTGDVTVGRLQGNARVRVESGTIFLRGIEGAVDASAEQGDIVISRCLGAVVARVQKGSIRTGSIGGAADLKNASGNIEVMLAKAGVRAEATAGDISVAFGREIRSAVELITSGGNIFVRLDPRSSCQLRAAATWGTVQCALPLQAHDQVRGKRTLSGQLNEGGPLLALRASGGNIKIEPGAPPFD